MTVSRLVLLTVSVAGFLRPTDTDSVMLLCDVSVSYAFNYTNLFNSHTYNFMYYIWLDVNGPLQATAAELLGS